MSHIFDEIEILAETSNGFFIYILFLRKNYIQRLFVT